MPFHRTFAIANLNDFNDEINENQYQFKSESESEISESEINTPPLSPPANLLYVQSNTTFFIKPLVRSPGPFPCIEGLFPELEGYQKEEEEMLTAIFILIPEHSLKLSTVLLAIAPWKKLK